MRVLFVCSGNAYRSPVAEAFFKKLRPDVEADSAGTNPAIPIAEEAKRFLEKEKTDQFLKEAPESLDDKQVGEYDLIVAMEQRHKDAVLRKCPECKHKIVVLNIQDPYFLPPGYAEKTFEQLKHKIEKLAQSL